VRACVRPVSYGAPVFYGLGAASENPSKEERFTKDMTHRIHDIYEFDTKRGRQETRRERCGAWERGDGKDNIRRS
jgi:hypothetical protein